VATGTRYIGAGFWRQPVSAAEICSIPQRRLAFSAGLPHKRGHHDTARRVLGMTDFATMRRMMVDGQIRPSDITDPRLIDAMLDIPREDFLPAGKARLAYLDQDLAVGGAGEGATIRRLLKPMVLAKMIQALDLDDDDRVLDVGCLTGYSSAVLGRLAQSVVALEEDTFLVSEARAALAKAGAANVKVVQGRLADGYRSDAPYDAIFVNGTVEIQPEALFRQLREGGRLVCIQGGGPAAKAMLYRLDLGDVGGRPVFDATAPVLPGFAAPKAFVF
jgi:protein-L-isoaspartate(D-aspartate) O-methyltransferase